MAISLDEAQDSVWCDLCPRNQLQKSLVDLHCKLCHINLCAGCAGKHLLSKKSVTHDIVEYKHKDIKPKYPECITHPGRKCELQCQKCHVPVCAMCLTATHQEHRFTEMSAFIDSKIAEIMHDNEELEKIIAPEYEKQDSELGTRMSEKSQKYDGIIKFIADNGIDWHEEVDKIITKYTTDVQNDKKEDLGHLQKYQSEMRNTKSLIYQTIKKNKKILKSNDATELANYRSRNDEFKQIPPRADFSLPSFQPIKIQGEELHSQFGTILASIKSEVEGYRISGSLSLLQLLDQSEVISTTDSGNNELYRLTCVENDQAWIIGHNKTIKCVNIHGEQLRNFDSACATTYPDGLSVTEIGSILYGDYTDRSVKMIENKKIHTMITLQDWHPLAVCSTFLGEILVLVETKQGGNVKLFRFSESMRKMETWCDHNGEPLFSPSLNKFHLRFIEENRNQDVCVQNDYHIVVVNQFGQLRFRYDGKHQGRKYTTFTPCGIATDSKCQILVADKGNNCVHVLDKDGQFLCYIDNCDLVSPCPVSVDSQDRLWVGLYDGKIKVIKYMK